MTGVALEMQVKMSAPLVGAPYPRFHALDEVGMPWCMRPYRPPIYPVDYSNLLGLAFVPAVSRCHRWGCSDRWPVPERFTIKAS